MSLSSFLKAARPEWSAARLAAVEEKLEKVGVTDVLDLVESLRGRSNQRLNSRLKACGEKCFTSETLSALRRRVREEPALRRAVQRKARQAELSDSDSSTAWNPAARVPRRGTMPMPTSKDDMIAALKDLGIEVTCQVRQTRAILLEARRLQSLQQGDLLQEAQAYGLDGEEPDLIRQILRSAFPEYIDREPSSEEELSFRILSPSVEPLSLSTLFSQEEEDLIQQCKARGICLEGMESRGKGFLALLLKLDSRREYLRSLEVT